MNKKFLKPVLALAIVAAMAVGGSLAYITANTDEVKNTFVTAHAGKDDNQILTVAIEEEFTDAENKKVGLADGVATATVEPGDKLTKQATVSLPVNTLENGSLVFIKVTKSADPVLDFSGITVDTTKWTEVAGYTDLYQYKETVNGTWAGETVFDGTTVAVPTSLTGKEVLDDSIIIDAFAIQATNITAAEAAVQANAAFTPAP